MPAKVRCEHSSPNLSGICCQALAPNVQRLNFSTGAADVNYGLQGVMVRRHTELHGDALRFTEPGLGEILSYP